MVYVFLADGFEEIEALATVDILRRAELDVVMAGVTGEIVRGAHGIVIACDCTIDSIDMDKAELIVLPGGMPGTLNLEKSEYVQSAIDYCVQNSVHIGAICAAPSILGHKGLLDGKQAVCFPGFENELAGAKLSEKYVVTDGQITTAKGAGSAVSFALELVSVVCSKAAADKIGASLQIG